MDTLASQQPGTKKKKYPLFAAVLNFVIPGLGYAYNGKRGLFAFLLLSVAVLFFIIFWIAISRELSLSYSDEWPYWLQVMDSLAYLMIGLAFAVDAYEEAEAINNESSEMQS